MAWGNYSVEWSADNNLMDHHSADTDFAVQADPPALADTDLIHYYSVDNTQFSPDYDKNFIYYI